MTNQFNLEDHPEIGELWELIIKARQGTSIGFDSKNEAKKAHIDLHRYRKAYKESFGEEDPTYQKMASWKISNPTTSGGFWVLVSSKRNGSKLKYKILKSK